MHNPSRQLPPAARFSGKAGHIQAAKLTGR